MAEDGEIVLEQEGISWGKWLFRGAMVLGAALAAPVVLGSISNVIGTDPGIMGNIGTTAGKWATDLSGHYATAASAIGIDKVAGSAISGEYFQNVLGDKSLTSIFGQAGSNIGTFVGENKMASGLLAAGALGAGAVIGQHTGRVVASRSTPVEAGIPVRA